MAPLLPSIRVFFISTGVLSLALLLKFSVPLMTEFSAHQAWSSFLSWLKPPYLYFVINGIIITIAASSRFHKNNEENQPEQLPVPVKMSTNPVPDFGYAEKVTAVIRSDFHLASAADDFFLYEQREAEEETEACEDKSVVVLNGSEDVDDEEAFLISRSAWIPPKRRDEPEIPDIISPAEKPLVSARFGHRKPVKASPEGGRALKVSKPKRHETLENTWKTITEGRAMPLTRHLKKSDTWENHGRHINVDTEDPPQVKKSETFKDRTNYQMPPETPSPVKLRKEPSLSQDELNRRVEAFIRKFNEEMRLQREESLNHYKAMVGR
ncbi:hypothetical protein HS088_TW21G01103 [Tripterygium wilfordii]|uniref:DUF4408 domain-containing protein n=1 Tax=Tripterygium wilfordii TaxID=458696 RepID=A0A7J7C539_TRIWF|nr:uncharacterized protein LOC119988261 [Tripterygium wilfordii]KAF5728947.1 hypothetical protein HS088_TW21G01103 [Tripterygium wilfordii]